MSWELGGIRMITLGGRRRSLRRRRPPPYHHYFLSNCCWLLATTTTFSSSSSPCCHGFLFASNRFLTNKRSFPFIILPQRSSEEKQRFAATSAVIRGRQFSSDILYSSSSSEAPTTTNASTNIHHRNVCVLQDDDNNNNNNNRDDTMKSVVAKSIAESLSLPIITLSADGRVVMTNDNNDINDFTHILRVEDYAETATILPENERYALAIQPTTTVGGGDKRQGRRTRRQPKKKHNNNKLPKIKPLWIDFCPPQPTKRSSSQQQPDLLLQAVAPQRGGGQGAVVYDLTAGWGQDSLLMALGGASKVCMVERDPIVACLLQDALRRLHCIATSSSSSDQQQSTTTIATSWQQRAKELDDKLSLTIGDARQVFLLNNEDSQSTPPPLLPPPLLPPPDIVYLDPMFPPRTKSAAVKKGMQILHGLFDETNQRQQQQQVDYEDDIDGEGSNNSTTTTIRDRDQEEIELLQMAYEMARNKVVVKRPIHSPALGMNDASGTTTTTTTTLKPSHVVKGSINRWDVYVK